MAEKANPANKNITRRIAKYATLASPAANTASHSLLSVLPKIDGIHSSSIQTATSTTTSTDSQSQSASLAHAPTIATTATISSLNPNLLNINNVNHVNAAYVNLQPLASMQNRQNNTQHDFASLLANNLNQSVIMQNLQAVQAPIMPAVTVSNGMNAILSGYNGNHLQTNQVSQQRYSPLQRFGVINNINNINATSNSINSSNVNLVNNQMDVSLIPNLDGTVSLHFKNIPLASALQILQQSILVSNTNQ